MVSRLQIKFLSKLAIAMLLVPSYLACRSTANVSSNAESIRPMRVVTDDLDRKVTIPTNVTRVVSLAPNLTESIFAVGAGDRLVGVTTFCNYPEQANEIAKIGDTMNPNMESIVALKPDIVFVSTASQIENFTKTLEANGIAVYVTNPTSLGDVYRTLMNLGEILGTSDSAGLVSGGLRVRQIDVLAKVFDWSPPMLKNDEDLDKNIREDIRKIRNPKGTPVFVQVSKEPLFTIGKQSFLIDLLWQAGGESVTKDVETAYPKLSKETASALNPEVIILSESPDNQAPNEAFKNSPAVKSGRIYKVNADLLSRPGPRLVDALEQIARDLHPEKFK